MKVRCRHADARRTIHTQSGRVGRHRLDFPGKLAEVFDPAPLGIVATDAEGRIVYVNRRQCELSAQSRADLIGQHYRTFLGPALREGGVLEACERLEGEGISFEVDLVRYRRRSDGAEVALSLRGYRHGRFNLFFTTINKTVAEQIRRYEQLFENANDGIFVLSRDGRFVEVNPEICRITGMAREELLGRTTEVVLPGRFEQSLARLDRIIAEGKLGPYEIEIDTPGGKKAISLNGFALYEAGLPVGIMNIARDVSERKLAERALERETSFVRLLKDVATAANEAGTVEEALEMALQKVCFATHCPVGCVRVVDAESHALGSTPIWYFDAAERFADFRSAVEAAPAPMGHGGARRVLERLRPAWIPDLAAEGTNPGWRAAREAGLSSGFAFPVLVEARVVAVLEFYCETTVDWDSSFVDVVDSIAAQLARVVEREKAKRELAAARDQAVDSARLKSSFLASMSHEIRTPLNGVIGMTGILLNTSLSPDQREYAETIRSSADVLLGLINDILDFSKIEAGKLVIEPIPFDLELAVQEVAELLAAKAAEKDLDLVVRYAPSAPHRLIGDPGRIRQILTNLLANAIKFTDSGHVFVDVDCDRSDDDTAWMRFSVQDTGIGIPADRHQEVFERFSQADPSTTRKYGGTGLGLAIAKQLAEAMGGTMGLRSRPGAGSTFWFLLPLPLDPMTPQARADAMPRLANVRVLVVDDNAVNRRILREIATRWGMRSQGAASAPEALAAFREGRASGDPFQIALVDMNMPDIDGETLARLVKSDNDLKDTVLILLTSSGQQGDASRMAQAGFAATMTKPLRPAVLMDALATAWAERPVQGEAVRVTRAQTPDGVGADSHERYGDKLSRMRVLVVEDNLVNQKVARLLLEGMGCRAELAANGKEAVEMFRRAPYDLIFMDCQMPIMDGYEATREIRRSGEAGTRVFIVAMTAHVMEGDVEKCLAAGMDDYLGKPVRRETLEFALERAVSEREGGYPDRLSSDSELHEMLDWMRREGGEEFADELIRSFLKNTARRINELGDTVAADDFEKAKFIVHDLKGSSATFGATKLAGLLRELDARISPDSLRAVEVDVLRREIQHLEAALARLASPSDERPKAARPG